VNMAVESGDIAIPLRLPEDEALALAQLCKRVDYDTCVRFTSRFDKYHGRDEGDVAWSAVNMLRSALAEAGFAPR
jgi:hypothetical protein